MGGYPNLEPFPGVIDPARGIDQPAGNIVLVKERKLNSHRREFLQDFRALDLLVAMLQVVEDHYESARSEEKENRQGYEVCYDNNVLHRRCVVMKIQLVTIPKQFRSGCLPTAYPLHL